MKAEYLKKALQDVPDDADVVFQGNVKGEYDSEDGDDMTHTSCTGFVFSVFHRIFDGRSELVVDCAITDQE